MSTVGVIVLFPRPTMNPDHFFRLATALHDHRPHFPTVHVLLPWDAMESPLVPVLEALQAEVGMGRHSFLVDIIGGREVIGAERIPKGFFHRFLAAGRAIFRRGAGAPAVGDEADDDYQGALAEPFERFLESFPDAVTQSRHLAGVITHASFAWTQPIAASLDVPHAVLFDAGPFTEAAYRKLCGVPSPVKLAIRDVSSMPSAAEAHKCRAHAGLQKRSKVALFYTSSALERRNLDQWSNAEGQTCLPIMVLLDRTPLPGDDAGPRNMDLFGNAYPPRSVALVCPSEPPTAAEREAFRTTLEGDGFHVVWGEGEVWVRTHLKAPAVGAVITGGQWPLVNPLFLSGIPHIVKASPRDVKAVINGALVDTTMKGASATSWKEAARKAVLFLKKGPDVAQDAPYLMEQQFILDEFFQVIRRRR